MVRPYTVKKDKKILLLLYRGAHPKDVQIQLNVTDYEIREARRRARRFPLIYTIYHTRFS
jgi:hypothetical protein